MIAEPTTQRPAPAGCHMRKNPRIELHGSDFSPRRSLSYNPNSERLNRSSEAKSTRCPQPLQGFSRYITYTPASRQQLSQLRRAFPCGSCSCCARAGWCISCFVTLSSRGCGRRWWELVNTWEDIARADMGFFRLREDGRVELPLNWEVLKKPL